MSDPKRVFICYAREDSESRAVLATGLKPLERQRLVQIWHDRKLMPGDKWDGEIHDRLETADIVIFLVSNDFLASDYIYDVEMKRAIERHESGEVAVIPVLVRACDWQVAPLKDFHILPGNAEPIGSWQNTDEAWTDVIMGIRRLCETRAAVPSEPHPTNVASTDERPSLEPQTKPEHRPIPAQTRTVATALVAVTLIVGIYAATQLSRCGRGNPAMIETFEQLFGETSQERQAAYGQIVEDWITSPELVPSLLRFARQRGDNKDGIFNTTKVLQVVPLSTLQRHEPKVRTFLRWIETLPWYEADGANTRAELQKVRRRLT